MRIAIIPARGGSKRIKNKNVIDFCGKPIIFYSLMAARKSNLFDKIHVSTDSKHISEVVESLGFGMDFLRDSKLADDYTGLLPVVKWVLQKYSSMNEKYNEVCLLLPTAPLVNHDDLNGAHELFLSNGSNSTVMACGLYPVPIQWAFRINQSGRLQPLDQSKLTIRSQDLEEYYYDSGTFYFLNSDNLDIDIGVDSIPYLLPKERSIDIDTHMDLELAKNIYRTIID